MTNATTKSQTDPVVEARAILNASNAYTLRIQVRELLGALCDELVEERRLRAELKQIAQTGIDEVSSVGTALKENAVKDSVDRFRSSIVSLIEAKADSLSRTSIAAEQNARTVSELRELAQQIGEMK